MKRARLPVLHISVLFHMFPWCMSIVDAPSHYTAESAKRCFPDVYAAESHVFFVSEALAPMAIPAYCC